MRVLDIYTVSRPYVAHRRSYWGVTRWRGLSAGWSYHLPMRFQA